MSSVQSIVKGVLGDGGDDAILEYIVGVLEEPHFDWGEDGDGVFEVIGEFLIAGGFVEDELTARDICQQLTTSLQSQNGQSNGSEFRALEQGPMRMADHPEATVRDDVDVRHLLENPLNNKVPEVNEKDRLKLERRQIKEDKQQRAALAARQAEAQAMMNDSIPIIQRNMYVTIQWSSKCVLCVLEVVVLLGISNWRISR